MKSYDERLAEANVIYEAGLRRVKEKAMPKGQKFRPGTYVQIASDLGDSMSHFEKTVRLGWNTLTHTLMVVTTLTRIHYLSDMTMESGRQLLGTMKVN